MALNIYKPGQGYWTRLLSGIGGGILVITAGNWIRSQIGAMWPDLYYVQWAALIVVIAGLGTLLYYYLGLKPRTTDFLIATEGEMKKVNWPSRQEVLGSTWVVICCVILFVILLYLADLVFSYLTVEAGINHIPSGTI